MKLFNIYIITENGLFYKFSLSSYIEATVDLFMDTL
jgi:hypothetical protein